MAGDTLGYLSIMAVFFGIPVLLVVYAIYIAITRGVEPESRQWLVDQRKETRDESGEEKEEAA